MNRTSSIVRLNSATADSILSPGSASLRKLIRGHRGEMYWLADPERFGR